MELVLAAELLRRQAVVLPHLVQVRLGRDQHARRLAVHEVLLPSTNQSGSVGRAQSGHFRTFKPMHLLKTYLVDFGTVFERLRVVGVVHQTDHVAGQVRLGQEVEVWHHLVELGGRKRGSGGG